MLHSIGEKLGYCNYKRKFVNLSVVWHKNTIITVVFMMDKTENTNHVSGVISDTSSEDVDSSDDEPDYSTANNREKREVAW